MDIGLQNRDKCEYAFDAKDLLTTLFESVYIVEPGTFSILDCNKIAWQILGSGKDELIGKSYLDLLLSPELAMNLKVSSAKDYSPCVNNNKRKLSDGEIVDVEFTIAKTSNEQYLIINERIKEIHFSDNEKRKKYFLALASISFEGVLLINAMGTVLYANQRCYEIMNFDNDDAIVGTNIRDWICEEDLERALAEVRDAFFGVYSTNDLYNMKNLKGEKIVCEINAKALNVGKEKTLDMVVILRKPIKRDWIYEQVDVDSNSKIFENDDLLWLVDKNLNYISYSETFPAFMKKYYDVDVQIGKSGLLGLPEGLIDVFRINYSKAFAGEVVVSKLKLSYLNYNMMRTFSFHRLIDYNSEVFSVAVCSYGNKEAQDNESIIIEESNRVQSIFESIDEPMWAIDKDFRVIALNKTFIKMFREVFGYDIELYDNILNHKITQQLEFWRECYFRAFAGESFSMDTEYKVFDENVCFMNKFHPIRDENGTVCGVTVRSINVNERKQWENELVLNESRISSLYKITQLETHDEHEFIRFALDEACLLSDSQYAYMHYYDEEKLSIELFAWSSDVEVDCKCHVDNMTQLSQAGLWGDCIRERKPLIHNDYPNAPEKRGMPEGHIMINRHLGIPILDNGKIVAVVGVANKTENYNSSDTRQLFLFMTEMWSILKHKKMLKQF